MSKEASSTTEEGASQRGEREPIAPRVMAFVLTALVWLILDQATKAYFNAQSLGGVLGGPYLGLFEFRLARNTGGAWSIFSDSTMVLAWLSVAICLAVLIFFIAYMREMTVLTVVSLALVFAGGIGNALDRFINGYVIDFISPVIIDFPIFNIADLGITCGIVLLVISLFVSSVHGAPSAEQG